MNEANQALRADPIDTEFPSKDFSCLFDIQTLDATGRDANTYGRIIHDVESFNTGRDSSRTV